MLIFKCILFGVFMANKICQAPGQVNDSYIDSSSGVANDLPYTNSGSPNPMLNVPPNLL